MGYTYVRLYNQRFLPLSVSIYFTLITLQTAQQKRLAIH